MPSTTADDDPTVLPSWPPPWPAPGTALARQFEEQLGVSCDPVDATTAPPAPPRDSPEAPAQPGVVPPPAEARQGAATLATEPGPGGASPARRVERPSGAWPATLPARHCPGGHPNPPTATQCRACGADVTDGTVTVIDRPLLGVLVLDDGRTVPLDRPLLLGRNPAEEAIDGRAAAAIRLDDPRRRLTRTHLEVRVVQWQVLVTDRGSTNGTVLTHPGSAPAKLEPHHPYELAPGAVLTLGDTHEIQFTAPPGEDPIKR